jgi:hypothetical protein
MLVVREASKRPDSIVFEYLFCLFLSTIGDRFTSACGEQKDLSEVLFRL